MNKVKQGYIDLSNLPQEPPIQLSEAAKKQVITQLKKDNAQQGLRLSVSKTGCSGLSYVMSYVNEINSEDLVYPLNEIYNLYVDKKSYPFLKGVNIDYVKEGLNKKFTFDNPNQKAQCGCGESFTVQDIN